MMDTEPKQFAVQSDAGNTYYLNFCGECGTTLFRDGPAFECSKVVNVGVLDDSRNALAEAKPAVELFSSSRISWVNAMPGTVRFKGMPGSEEVE